MNSHYSGFYFRFYHEFNENAKLANKIGYVFRTTF